MTSFKIGQVVKIDVTVLDDAGYEDMAKFHKKTGTIVGIDNVLPGLIQVAVGRKYVLLRPICLK